MATTSGGFLGRLKEGARNAIFEDENPIQAQPEKVTQAVQPIGVVPPSTTVVSFPVGSQSRQVNPEIKAQLDQAVAEANQLSYTEFVNYLEAMSSALAGNDEATHYRAALAAAAKKGFTPQEIARGIDAILQVLQNEERNFNEAASQRIAERVGNRESELADMERQITDNSNKIAQLQNQNSQLNSRKRTVSEEIRSERQKVEERKKDFAATVAAETGRYQEEKQRILSYTGRGG